MSEPTQVPPPRDRGLRQMLIYTFIALAISILLAIVGVSLAVHFFDRPQP